VVGKKDFKKIKQTTGKPKLTTMDTMGTMATMERI
jgi:hypothetical protein